MRGLLIGDTSMQWQPTTNGSNLPQAALVVDELTANRSGGTVSFGPGEAIYEEGDPAICFYKVKSGAVRSYKVLIDGRRQITGFYFVDDFFGVEPGLEHRLSAEATRATRALAYVHSGSERGLLLQLDDCLSREVALSAVNDLRRSHEHAVLLGRKTAIERVASFLLDTSDRMKSDRFDLPISRLDIADYLGLTIETVSRIMAKLARDGIIAMQNDRRTIALRNRAALCRLQEA
jgi:CRP/FNR family nitrogen fixation transcriptional regulator